MSEKKSFVQSFLWPFVMLIVHGFVGVILFIVIVRLLPEFELFCEEFNAELPAMTQLLITSSRLVAQYWWLVLPLFGIVDIALLFGLSQLPRSLRWIRGVWFSLVLLNAIIILAFVVIATIMPLAGMRAALN